MNTQGSALKPVTLRRGNQFEPTWAPVGGKLAYVSGTLSAGTNIWTVLASGKGDRRLTPLHADAQLNPSWSPDGHSVVYEDCLAGNIAGCTLLVKPLGASPVGISTLHAPFLDTFDAGVQDRFWTPHQDGTGAQTSAQNGQVVMSIAADAIQGGTFNRIDGGWLSACQLAGDFDVQADYQLLQWPAANGVQATLDASDLGAGPFRESQTYGESYGSYIPPAGAQSTITAASAGTLRIQRQGDTASTSYQTSGGSWAPIQSGRVPAVPTFIGLDISSMNNFFSHQTVTIAWDNFRINAGTMSCPNLSWEDDTPDWQAAPA
jgi:hypothetical protein